MSQNRSSAVMQRRSEPHNSLDDFPTPPWATRALCEWIAERAKIFDESPSCFVVREPAANRGHMVRPLMEYFHAVEASDVHDYGVHLPVRDYLFGPLDQTAWTITNPPFRLAQQFIERALDTSHRGVAMLVRTSFLEGVTRHRELFTLSPPTDILQFTERVVMHRGKLVAKGSSATSYCWLVWDLSRGGEHPRLHWIAPCRRGLERPGDYP
ncbi:methyltransferase [Mameliella alba]|uniref:methyltransferase n=1 Tax=Mameliella alba TaxID=561184 RepID=UPI000B52B49F|nr:methyltransferase [Mameliella alba]OWV64582.1 methyltransferase [Mameliella alba]